jgi:hypothetical protein
MVDYLTILLECRLKSTVIAERQLRLSGACNVLSAAMRKLRTIAVALVVCSGNLSEAVASPARFWISTSNSDPGSPQAPIVVGPLGATRNLHIWAQPATVNPAAPYDVNTNRFRTLQNFSLNLVANEPMLDLVDGTFTVYNPVLDGSSRFQFISDSQTPVTDVSGPLLSDVIEAGVISGTPDSISGLQGFSIANAGFSGLGHSANHPTAGCHPADPFCASTPDGSPAWLVASVSLKSLASSGTATLHLQIGANGMIYLADVNQAAEVTFGVNNIGTGPIYNSQLPAQRGITLAGDEPDAVMQAAAGLAGDFNADLVVDAADYVTWRNGLGTTHTPVEYVVWRANFGAASGDGSLLANVAIPEPATLVMVLVGTHAAFWFRRTALP